MAKKILLCEDSTFFAQAINMVLSNVGYEVVHAEDGAKGIEILQNDKSFSLILCDIMMPNVDGFGVINSVRSDDQLRDIPFIFLTGVSDMESMNKAQEYHVRDYFIKSNVGIDKIVELVKKNIGDA